MKSTKSNQRCYRVFNTTQDQHFKVLMTNESVFPLFLYRHGWLVFEHKQLIARKVDSK